MNNPTQNYELTIIVPVYNEQESLPRVERAMKEYLVPDFDNLVFEDKNVYID